MNKPAVGFLSFLAGAAITSAAGGGWYYVNHIAEHGEIEQAPQIVSTIRIELQKMVNANVEGSTVDIAKRINLMGNPDDFYIVIQPHQGEPIKLETQWDTPIGNGLRWSVEPPMLISEIAEIHIKDADTFSDDLVDRVIVDGREQSGGYFDVLMLAEPMPGTGEKPDPSEAAVKEQDEDGNV